MDNAQLINQTSGDFEYYTPPNIIEAARKVMGSINLDPASCKKANEIVEANEIFTKYSDGLSKEWYGNIWVNHPFSRINNPLWVEKIVDSYYTTKVNQIMCINYACTSELWFKPLHKFAQCYIYGRTNFFLPDGSIKKGNTKGCVITYMGKNIGKFISVFSKLGSVKISMEVQNV